MRRVQSERIWIELTGEDLVTLAKLRQIWGTDRTETIARALTLAHMTLQNPKRLPISTDQSTLPKNTYRDCTRR